MDIRLLRRLPSGSSALNCWRRCKSDAAGLFRGHEWALEARDAGVREPIASTPTPADTPGRRRLACSSTSSRTS
ncbi:MAG: hypothetical protein WA208_13090, partial [Thermoanaerobaculia bacterium]